ncbi:ATP synthase subunit O, mitochondrial [Trichoplax sp. H2]|nr:ATP synthase subunit O, mitochondrial [Trichoplax sp. H2]|eukprot:RDD46812.1 ATP synthase subunit O, mitochondrial [Trichoplax sp. H2]
MASQVFRATRMAANVPISQAGLAVRCLSTSSVHSDLAKAPIKVFGVQGRYAHAIYSAATKQKCLEKVEKDLMDMKQSIDSDIQLERLIANPFMKRQVKRGVLEELLRKRNAHELSLKVFGTLSENNRLGSASEIIEAFSRIMEAHRGEVRCTITTAKKLNNDQLKNVKDSLQGFIAKNQKLQIGTEVDPKIIGGMIVDIDDKYIDMSIASRIKKVMKAMNTAT